MISGDTLGLQHISLAYVHKNVKNSETSIGFLVRPTFTPMMDIPPLVTHQEEERLITKYVDVQKISTGCYQRGVPLQQLCDEARLNVSSFQHLYKSSVGFFFRKSIQGEVEA